MATQKNRLDKLLVDRGIAPTLDKDRSPVSVDTEIHIKGEENHSPASNKS
jgi:hypothetical protein